VRMATSMLINASGSWIGVRLQLICRVVRLRCSPKFNDVGTNPLGQFCLRTAPRCGRQHRGNNIGFCSDKVESVQAKEYDHRQERHPLVAVAVWMVLHNAEAVCRSQARNIWTFLVSPFVTRSCKRRLEESLVAKARQASVFANLIEVYCVDNDALHPARFHRLHGLLCKLAERIAVALGRASGNGERLLGVGVVRREQNAVFSLDGEKPVTRRDSETVCHVFWKSCAYGAANSTYRDFFDHLTHFVEAT
jgi:hypothetical protein